MREAAIGRIGPREATSGRVDATVGINLRGTGCSGGVFDVFSEAEQADGYDAIEIVARQPWVLHNHVGMVGLSYSGNTQLYVGSTKPPHLAALASLSVIEDSIPH